MNLLKLEEQAFDRRIRAILPNPVLAFPLPNIPSVANTEASDYHVKAAVFQIHAGK